MTGDKEFVVKDKWEWNTEWRRHGVEEVLCNWSLRSLDHFSLSTGPLSYCSSRSSFPVSPTAPHSFLSHPLSPPTFPILSVVCSPFLPELNLVFNDICETCTAFSFFPIIWVISVGHFFKLNSNFKCIAHQDVLWIWASGLGWIDWTWGGPWTDSTHCSGIFNGVYSFCPFMACVLQELLPN